MSELEPKITLEDVELAVRVIERFLRARRESEHIIRRLSRIGGTQRRGMGGMMPKWEDIVSIVMEQKRAEAGVGAPSEVEVKPLTKEELERFRKIKEQIKKREVGSGTHRGY